MIIDMMIKGLQNPSAQKMMNGKMREMFDFLAEMTGTTRNDVGLFMKLENVPVKVQKKDEKGKTMVDEKGMTVWEEVFEETVVVKKVPKMVKVQKKGADGNVEMNEGGVAVMEEVAELDGTGTPVILEVKETVRKPKMEEKGIIYVYVKGAAVQKISVQEFLALAGGMKK